MSAAMHTNARGHGPVPRDAGSAGQQPQAGALPARDRGNLPRREGAGRRLAHSDAAGQLRPAPTSCAAREAANEVRAALGGADARAVDGAWSVPPDKLAPAVSQPPGPSLGGAPYRGWKITEVRRLAQMRAAGCTREEAAAALGRTVGSVKGMLSRAKVPHERARHYRQWTAEERARARRLRAAGHDDDAIGRALGRTARAVNNALRRRGAPLGRPPLAEGEIAATIETVRRLGRRQAAEALMLSMDALKRRLHRARARGQLQEPL